MGGAGSTVVCPQSRRRMVPGMGRTQPLLARRAAARPLGIATLVLVISGCTAPAAQVTQEPSISAEATVTSDPDPTASPSPTPSPAPTDAPSPSAPAPSGRAAIAQVVTTDLVMRSAPGTGSDSQIYDPSLSSPVLLYILDGPVAADGYDWYRVAPFDEFYTDVGRGGPGVGWVADGGKDGEAWIAPWTGTCPTSTAEDLIVRSPLVALACFGNRELSLEGTLGDCFDSSPGPVMPSWLWSRPCLLVPFDYESQLGSGFVFHLESASPQVGQGEAVRVTGHYDDSAAPTCALNPGAGLDQFPPDLIVLYCRRNFVATELTQTTAP